MREEQGVFPDPNLNPNLNPNPVGKSDAKVRQHGTATGPDGSTLGRPEIGQDDQDYEQD
jgi:hypothetical protein